MTRRALLAASGALAGCSRSSSSGTLSGQRIRWIVPFPAGGSYDVFSRLLEKPLEQALDAEIIVSNEPGGGGLIGSTRLRDAPPDGRTLGILNTPGLLVSTLAGQAGAPNPARDFTILGRISRARTVLAVSGRSQLRSVEDLLAHARVKPPLAALSGPASTGGLSFSAFASLLGLRVEFVTGYAGSREEQLGLMRGEFDLLSGNYESLETGVRAGELRVIATWSELPEIDSADPGPRLMTGPQGWAARRASATGRTLTAAIEEAANVARLIESGIIAAAPRGLPPDLVTLLRSKFDQAARDPSFVEGVRASRRKLDIANGAETEASLAAVFATSARFAPLLRGLIERTRR